MRAELDEFDEWLTTERNETLLQNAPNLAAADDAFPPSRMLNDEDGFLLLAEMLDYGREDVQIDFQNQELRVTSPHRAAPERTGFFKHFRLPDPIRSEDIHVWFESGFLFVWLPKDK